MQYASMTVPVLPISREALGGTGRHAESLSVGKHWQLGGSFTNPDHAVQQAARKAQVQSKQVLQVAFALFIACNGCICAAHFLDSLCSVIRLRLNLPF